VIVVVASGYFELDSIVQLTKTINKVQSFFNLQLHLLGPLFKLLRQAYTDRVLATIIPRNTDMKDAMFNKRDIFSFNPRAKAAQAYDKLIRELFNRCSTYEKDTQYPGN
jgi:chromosome partitioning protein